MVRDPERYDQSPIVSTSNFGESGAKEDPVVLWVEKAARIVIKTIVAAIALLWLAYGIGFLLGIGYVGFEHALHYL